MIYFLSLTVKTGESLVMKENLIFKGLLLRRLMLKVSEGMMCSLRFNLGKTICVILLVLQLRDTPCNFENI